MDLDNKVKHPIGTDGIHWNNLAYSPQERKTHSVGGRYRQYITPSIFEIIEQNSRHVLPAGVSTSIVFGRPAKMTTDYEKLVAEVAKILEKHNAELKATLKQLLSLVKKDIRIDLCGIQRRFRCLYRIDIRYLIRTIIRPLHIVTFDGKDEDGGFTFMNSRMVNHKFLQLKKIKCLIERFYYRWSRMPSVIWKAEAPYASRIRCCIIN